MGLTNGAEPPYALISYSRCKSQTLARRIGIPAGRC
jgi:hypothetical protein